jgi:hypothetical protein
MVLGKRSRGALACSTAQLAALNSRLKNATSDCLLLTEQVRAESHRVPHRKLSWRTAQVSWQSQTRCIQLAKKP